MIGTKAEVLKHLIDSPDGMYEVKDWHPKRSLSQNSYFHKLVGLIAKALRTSDTEIKNNLIADYGVVDIDIGPITIRDDVPWNRLTAIHVRPTAKTKVQADGKLYRAYWVMKGTHELTTVEMAHLLDGTIEEAKVLGIETLPPHELERIRRLEMEAEERRNGRMENDSRV